MHSADSGSDVFTAQRQFACLLVMECVQTLTTFLSLSPPSHTISDRGFPASTSVPQSFMFSSVRTVNLNQPLKQQVM